MRLSGRAASALAALALIIAAWVWMAMNHRGKAPDLVSAPVSKAPASKPAPEPTTASRPDTHEVLDTYQSVVKSAYPEYPTTAPFEIPLDLTQASHFRIPGPMYLGGAGRNELWIARADAPAIEKALNDAVDPKKDIDVHVVPERIAFVHWMPNERGVWSPTLICAAGENRFEAVSLLDRRVPLPSIRRYDWAHAISWNDKVVVPSEGGASILRLGARVTEQYIDLAGEGPQTQPSDALAATRPASGFARVLLDWAGAMAWMPWQADHAESGVAAHFTEGDGASGHGVWTRLDAAAGWPSRIVHLVPLLDGTVLVMSQGNGGDLEIQYRALDKAAIDEKAIGALVEQLSDSDPTKREAAYEKLAQYGSGIWPILEKLKEDQGPEGQARIKTLLRQRSTPSLNGMDLLGKKKLELVARLSDGGTVFYAAQGVSIPNKEDPDSGPEYRVPAWIAIRPGHAIEPLPPVLSNELSVEKCHIFSSGNDWIITDDIHGARRFVGAGFVKLLHKSERGFKEFVGVDRRGRWVFRKPGATDSDESLVLDPWMPDPTLRLPLWEFNTAETVGWTAQDWPVAKHGSAYALHEAEWQLLGDSDQIYTKAEQAPATDSARTPLLTDRDGNTYFGGLKDLTFTTKKGEEATWPLPDVATGDGKPWLIRTRDRRLYLFNRPGRVLRIRATPGEPAPFKLEKIFTHRIPSVDRPTRIWLDPAGRIIMAHENQLAILFPDGYIPQAIADKMTPAPDDDDE